MASGIQILNPPYHGLQAHTCSHRHTILPLLLSWDRTHALAKTLSIPSFPSCSKVVYHPKMSLRGGNPIHIQWSPEWIPVCQLLRHAFFYSLKIFSLNWCARTSSVYSITSPLFSQYSFSLHVRSCNTLLLFSFLFFLGDPHLALGFEFSFVFLLCCSTAKDYSIPLVSTAVIPLLSGVRDLLLPCKYCGYNIFRSAVFYNNCGTLSFLPVWDCSDWMLWNDIKSMPLSFSFQQKQSQQQQYDSPLMLNGPWVWLTA